MWLINWLSNRATAVLQWFGSSYWTWSGRVQNFFAHLQDYRDQAYAWAKSWSWSRILEYYYLARDYVVSKYNSAIAWVNTTRQSIQSWATGRIQEVWNFADLAYRSAWSIWVDIRGWVQSKIDPAVTAVRAWVKVWITDKIKPFNWILGFKDLLEGLKDLFSEENLRRLSLLWGSLFPAVLAFATKPLATLLSVIQPIFLDLLSFSVAYALGTEKAELPDWPDWSTYGSGGGGGFLPLGVGQDLNAPLTPLWISGYTFNNPIGHMAIDLGCSYGQPLYAMHDGIIEYTNQAYVGYGFQITIRGGDWWTRYAHLMDINVSPGQSIKKGQQIGKADTTGNSTGNHLHLEIKYKGSFIDPAKILF